jgi:hypothetical protein
VRQLIRVSVAAVLCGCASYPPERVERDQLILAAVQPCKERYADQLYNTNLMSVNQDGTVRYWVRDTRAGDVDDINGCLAEAQKGLKVGPWAPGRPAKPSPANVPLTATASGADLLVTVRVNGVPGTMVIATNSDLTMITPAYAGRAGLRLASESPSTRAVIGGKDMVLPFVRARTVEVGDTSVEPLDIVLHETFPADRGIDGVLGNSFLGGFKLSIDRRNSRLALEPLARP